MGALTDDTQRELARQLLFAAQPALGLAATGPDGKPDVAAQEAARLAFLTKQCVFRMRVACKTSHKWSVVIEEACEIYKADLAPAPKPVAAGTTPSEVAKPTADDSAKQALRASIWKEVAHDVEEFAVAHDLRPGAVTTETISGAKMVEVVRDAILRNDTADKDGDPSDYLLQAKIWTADEQNARLQQLGAGKSIRVNDAVYKEEDLIAAINSASDEHVATQWTSVASPGQTRQQTMKDVYANYQRAFLAAKPRMDEHDARSGALRPATAQEAAYDPSAPMTAAPKATYRAEVHGLDERDPLLLEEERTKRLFLEYTIEVSQALEMMLKPFMGDNREKAAVTTSGYTPHLSGSGNKRYDNLTEVVLGRASNLDVGVLAKVLGMDPDDTWLLKTEMRRQVNSFGLRHEKNLRSRGAQTSEGTFASAEKQELDTTRIDYGRAMAVATTDGKIDGAEKQKLDQLGSENDRAREAYKTALETSAMWASLIVGTLLTIVVTILTGGLALGPVAAMALGAATAALSATAQGLVKHAIEGQEYDSKDFKDDIVREVLTGLVQAGSAFYAAKMLKVASNLGTVARQTNAVRQVLQEQPGVWRVFLAQTGEQVASTAMGSVVEAGLEATNPEHFIEGYEEGNQEAWAAASARMGSFSGEIVSGVITSLVAAKANKVFGRHGTHVEYPDATRQRRAVNLMANVKKVFGDPEQKIAGALVEWAMTQHDDPVDWYKAPGELFAGALRQYGQVSQEVHSHTASLSTRGKQTHDSMAIFGHLLTPAEKLGYEAMNAHAGNTDAFVTAQQYTAIRTQIATTGLQSWEAQHGPLTNPQREAFVHYVRGAGSADELAMRAHSNPLDQHDVREAMPDPVVAHESSAHVPVSERTTQRQMHTVSPEGIPPDERITQAHPVPEVPAYERVTQRRMAVENPNAPKFGVNSGARKIYEEHPAILHLAELPAEALLGAHQQHRIEPALQALSESDYHAFRELEGSVADPVAKGFLYKALAAGHSVGELAWLATEMSGKDASWLIDNLTLGDPRGVGGGIKQQWSMSCNASMTITLHGNYDPIFALHIRQRNAEIGAVDENDPTALNMHQADLEKEMLESKYKGTGWSERFPNEHHGKATPRTEAGIGRPADDLLNDISRITGITFKSRAISNARDSLPVLDAALSTGLQVPLLIGRPGAEHAHYLLAMRRRATEHGFEYQFRDTGTGTTVWVSGSDIAENRMPFDWSHVTGIEVPSGMPPVTHATMNEERSADGRALVGAADEHRQSQSDGPEHGEDKSAQLVHEQRPAKSAGEIGPAKDHDHATSSFGAIDLGLHLSDSRSPDDVSARISEKGGLLAKLEIRIAELVREKKRDPARSAVLGAELHALRRARVDLSDWMRSELEDKLPALVAIGRKHGISGLQSLQQLGVRGHQHDSKIYEILVALSDDLANRSEGTSLDRISRVLEPAKVGYARRRQDGGTFEYARQLLFVEPSDGYVFPAALVSGTNNKPHETAYKSVAYNRFESLTIGAMHSIVDSIETGGEIDPLVLAIFVAAAVAEPHRNHVGEVTNRILLATRSPSSLAFEQFPMTSGGSLNQPRDASLDGLRRGSEAASGSVTDKEIDLAKGIFAKRTSEDISVFVDRVGIAVAAPIIKQVLTDAMKEKP